jgi:hypothetical protein
MVMLEVADANGPSISLAFSKTYIKSKLAIEGLNMCTNTLFVLLLQIPSIPSILVVAYAMDFPSISVGIG